MACGCRQNRTFVWDMFVYLPRAHQDIPPLAGLVYVFYSCVSQLCGTFGHAVHFPRMTDVGRADRRAMPTYLPTYPICAPSLYYTYSDGGRDSTSSVHLLVGVNMNHSRPQISQFVLHHAPAHSTRVRTLARLFARRIAHAL